MVTASTAARLRDTRARRLRPSSRRSGAARWRCRRPRADEQDPVEPPQLAVRCRRFVIEDVQRRTAQTSGSQPGHQRIRADDRTAGDVHDDRLLRQPASSDAPISRGSTASTAPRARGRPTPRAGRRTGDTAPASDLGRRAVYATSQPNAANRPAHRRPMSPNPTIPTGADRGRDSRGPESAPAATPRRGAGRAPKPSTGSGSRSRRRPTPPPMPRWRRSVGDRHPARRHASTSIQFTPTPGC